MGKKKWIQKGAVGLIAVMLLAGGAFPGLASANENVDWKNQEKLSTIQNVNPGSIMDEITTAIKEYAISEGITESESLEVFYKEAQVQLVEQKDAESSLNALSKPNQYPGPALRKGDIMYSVAYTGVNHGHNAIYYTRTTVVHAPKPGQISRAESAYNNIGVKNGVQLQYVRSTQANRDRAANYSYNNLRNRPYDLVFYNNKVTLSKLNCSSLVWNAYRRTSGIDLDRNGGPGVYPADIRDSSLTQTYAWR